MLKRVLNYKADIMFVEDIKNIQELSKVLRQSTLLIDGIFGIGLTRNVSGIYADVVNIINNFLVSVGETGPAPAAVNYIGTVFCCIHNSLVPACAGMTHPPNAADGPCASLDMVGKKNGRE